ncbi:MAG: SUMF1/EgtB/PvdO family nonheme iron enzyme, partial [Prevotellaceae bacterium]|nr:SUMF1/EgtB/PvdO family nonheme iron enzyme [Prevotellaceae bacterium]
MKTKIVLLILLFCCHSFNNKMNAQIEKPVVPAVEKPAVRPDKPPPADKPKPADKPILVMDYLTVSHKDVGKFNYSEAEEMCETLNNSNWSGYNDWRLPTLTELKLIRSNIKGLTGSYGSQDGILNFSNGAVDADYGWQNKNFSLRPVRADKPKSVPINVTTQGYSNSSSSSQTRHPAEPEMVSVQGGTFWMGCSSEQGSECYGDESPLHRVTVSSFNIGKYEVTQAQWKAVMGSNPSNFKGDNLPVEQVSWTDVQEFISRLNAATGKNYRLPTEAEWEYAARGGNKSKGYKYSGSSNINDVAWFTDYSG